MKSGGLEEWGNVQTIWELNWNIQLVKLKHFHLVLFLEKSDTLEEQIAEQIEEEIEELTRA